MIVKTILCGLLVLITFPGVSAPIHNAARKGNLYAIKLQLRKKVNVNLRDAEGWTPLHYAVEHGSGAVINYLLARGANVRAKNNYSATPLLYARFPGTVRLLLRKKADINARNKWGESLLHWAAEHGNVILVSYLLRSRANANIKNNEGSTPLHYAAIMGQHRVIPVLKRYGANINARNNFGLTPLHMAVEKGKYLAVTTLTGYGANINLQSTKEYPKYGIPASSTPLHVAVKTFFTDWRVILFLKKKGAKLKIADASGNLPVDIAKREYNKPEDAYYGTIKQRKLKKYRLKKIISMLKVK